MKLNVSLRWLAITVPVVLIVGVVLLQSEAKQKANLGDSCTVPQLVDCDTMYLAGLSNGDVCGVSLRCCNNGIESTRTPKCNALSQCTLPACGIPPCPDIYYCMPAGGTTGAPAATSTIGTTGTAGVSGTTSTTTGTTGAAAAAATTGITGTTGTTAAAGATGAAGGPGTTGGSCTGTPCSPPDTYHPSGYYCPGGDHLTGETSCNHSTNCCFDCGEAGDPPCNENEWPDNTGCEDRAPNETIDILGTCVACGHFTNPCCEGSHPSGFCYDGACVSHGSGNETCDPAPHAATVPAQVLTNLDTNHDGAMSTREMFRGVIGMVKDMLTQNLRSDLNDDGRVDRSDLRLMTSVLRNILSGAQ